MPGHRTPKYPKTAMRVLIVTPAPRGSTKGNRITAERWSGFLHQLGHDVLVADKCVEGEFDRLITLHATRSYSVIKAFQQQCPSAPVTLCMTGTDLHLDLQGRRGEDARGRASASMAWSRQIVLLEPEAARGLPADIQRRVTVIHQSATPVERRPKPLPELFELSVVGHLREEKDPFLASRAAQELPPESRISISHIGAALNTEMEQFALDRMKSNPRYQWLGSLQHQETQRHLARSRLMVLSSKIEGAPSAISEAIVNRVPILATKIPATVGLLGKDYAGLFPVGDFMLLSKLMFRAECDPTFLSELTDDIEQLAPRFAPTAELRALRQLLT